MYHGRRMADPKDRVIPRKPTGTAKGRDPNRKPTPRTEAEKYAITKARRQAKKEIEVPAKRKLNRKTCKGLNMRGLPCQSPPLKRGTMIDGEEASGDYCIFHDHAIPSSGWRKLVQIGQEAQSPGRRPRPFDIAARAMELAPQFLMQPYFEALGIRMNDDTGEIEADPDNPVGMRLYGLSKDGRVRMSPHPNLEAQVRIAEKLADRFYGKARTASEMSGTSGMSIQIEIPQNMDRARVVASVLFEAGAVNGQAEALRPALEDDVIEGTAAEDHFDE